MIELLFLWQLCKPIGRIAHGKKRSVFGYRVLLVAMWLGCEFLFLIGASIAGLHAANVYLFGIVGAIIGAAGAFMIAKSQPPLEGPPTIENTGGFPVIHSQQIDPPA